MMNQEIGKEWVTRLRSGAYEQGTHRMRCQADRYCCLGVLGDVLVDRGIAQWELEGGGLGGPPGNQHLTYCLAVVGPNPAARAGRLTRHLREEAGLTEFDQEQLIAMNDVEGATFNVIADFIETELLQESQQ